MLLLSFRLTSALLSGGGGGNSSSPTQHDHDNEDDEDDDDFDEKLVDDYNDKGDLALTRGGQRSSELPCCCWWLLSWWTALVDHLDKSFDNVTMIYNDDLQERVDRPCRSPVHSV